MVSFIVTDLDWMEEGEISTLLKRICIRHLATRASGEGVVVVAEAFSRDVGKSQDRTGLDLVLVSTVWSPSQCPSQEFGLVSLNISGMKSRCREQFGPSDDAIRRRHISSVVAAVRPTRFVKSAPPNKPQTTRDRHRPRLTRQLIDRSQV